MHHALVGLYVKRGTPARRCRAVERPTVLPDESMSTNTLTTEDSLHRHSTTYNRLGVDEYGRSHFASATRGVVWVLGMSGGLVHVQETSDIDGWVDYCEDTVGWLSLRYVRGGMGEWAEEVAA